MMRAARVGQPAGSTRTAAEIRDGMRRRVPKYRVPAQVRILEKLPLSTSGKTDRKALAMMLSAGSV